MSLHSQLNDNIDWAILDVFIRRIRAAETNVEARRYMAATALTLLELQKLDIVPVLQPAEELAKIRWMGTAPTHCNPDDPLLAGAINAKCFQCGKQFAILQIRMLRNQQHREGG